MYHGCTSLILLIIHAHSPTLYGKRISRSQLIRPLHENINDLRKVKVLLKYYQVVAWVLARPMRVYWLRPLDLTVAALQLPSCCGVSHEFAKREAHGLCEQCELY